MIGEAVDTAITLGWALAAWITVLAVVGAVVLLAGTAVGMWAVRGAWRVLHGRWRAADARKAAGEGQGPRSAADARREPQDPSDAPWSAPQTPNAPDNRPHAHKPASGHTAPSWARTDKDAA